MEQYGYTEDYYDQKKSGPVMRVLKWIVVLIIVAVMAILVYRMWSEKSYPDDMLELYFNDTLTEHYEAVGKDMKVYTQELRVDYDTETYKGNFFVRSILLIPDADQIQLSIRYSEGSLNNLQETYGDAVDGNDPFIYKLTDNKGNSYPLTLQVEDSARRYYYRKLIFDGVPYLLPHELGIEDGALETQELLDETGGPYYLCLDVYLPGVEERVARVPVFETHVRVPNQKDQNVLREYAVEPYRVSKDEWPE